MSEKVTVQSCSDQKGAAVSLNHSYELLIRMPFQALAMLRKIFLKKRKNKFTQNKRKTMQESQPGHFKLIGQSEPVLQKRRLTFYVRRSVKNELESNCLIQSVGNPIPVSSKPCKHGVV